jgi:hypothetical protein
MVFGFGKKRKEAASLLASLRESLAAQTQEAEAIRTQLKAAEHELEVLRQRKKDAAAAEDRFRSEYGITFDQALRDTHYQTPEGQIDPEKLLRHIGRTPTPELVREGHALIGDILVGELGDDDSQREAQLQDLLASSGEHALQTRLASIQQEVRATEARIGEIERTHT